MKHWLTAALMATTVLIGIPASTSAAQPPDLNDTLVALATLKMGGASDAEIGTELGLLSAGTASAPEHPGDGDVTVAIPQLYRWPGGSWIAWSTYEWNGPWWGGRRAVWELPPCEYLSCNIDDIGYEDRFGIAVHEKTVLPRNAGIAGFCSTDGHCEYVEGAMEANRGSGASFEFQDETPLGCFLGLCLPNGDYTAVRGFTVFAFDFMHEGCHRFTATYAHTWSTAYITAFTLSASLPGGFGTSVQFSDESRGKAYNSYDYFYACTVASPSGYVLTDTGDRESANPPSLLTPEEVPRVAEPLLVYDQGDASMKAYRWRSDETEFLRMSDYQSGAYHLSAVGDRVATGDVDGDGLDDVVMAYQNGDYTFDFWVFPKGGGSARNWYHSGTFSLDQVGSRLVVGDFNGDGMAEPALIYNDGDGTFTTYRWLSDGTSFARTTDYVSGAFDLARIGDRVATGDVNADGKDDIVMAYQNPDNSFSYWVFKGGTTSGNWYTSGGFGLTPVGNRLVVGDFNGDGKAEPALVYNDGDGTFTTYRWLSTGTAFSRTTDYQSGSFDLTRVGDRVAADDVDGDGKDDIVMAYQNPDYSFDYWIFKQGVTSAKWYSSGTFSLDQVGSRMLLGNWT